MCVEILCEVKFPPRETKRLDALAARLGITPELAVRRAVAFFSAQCVPTQRKAKKPGTSKF